MSVGKVGRWVAGVGPWPAGLRAGSTHQLRRAAALCLHAPCCRASHTAQLLPFEPL